MRAKMNQIFFKNGDVFTPSKIIGIGRNYTKHIKEMKSQPTEEPVIFIKPNSSIHNLEDPVPIPKDYGSVHHEIELAVCIGNAG